MTNDERKFGAARKRDNAGTSPATPGYAGTRDERWQVKRIEFEYESRNFRDHGHAAEECDMIVCWNHNWAECPAGIEVIALSEVVEKSGKLKAES